MATRAQFRSIFGSYGQAQIPTSEVDLVRLDETRRVFYEPPWQYFLESGEINDAFWAFQLQPRTVEVSPIYVAILRDCVVLPNGVVLLKDGSVLLETIFPASIDEFQRAVERQGAVEEYTLTHQARVADGELDTIFVDRAVHCRDRGESGYFHWLSAIMPRVNLIRSHTSLGGLPHLIEPPPGFGSSWVEEIAPDLLIQRSNRRPVFARELIYPAPAQVGSSHYARNPMLLQLFIDALYRQGSFGVAASEGRRRLYITRGDAPVRRLANEDVLLSGLTPLGFERVMLDGMPVREQIQLFRDAETIVGPHGAGLTNVLFCQPGTTVIELMSQRRVWPGFKVIACAVGARYAAYVAETFDGEQTDRVGAGNEDFTVRLESCLRFIKASASAPS